MNVQKASARIFRARAPSINGRNASAFEYFTVCARIWTSSVSETSPAKTNKQEETKVEMLVCTAVSKPAPYSSSCFAKET